MKRRLEVVLGLSLACIIIVAMVIQVTFGGSGIDLSIQPYAAKVEVGSTCTYSISLFCFEGNWFKIKILPGTCDPNWFEWLDSGQINLKEGDTEQITLNVTPSKAGEYDFSVRADTWFGETLSERGARIKAIGLTCIGLQPNLPSPQKIPGGRSEIIWTAYACDPEAGEIEYRFKLNGPRTNYAIETVKDWSIANEWVWITDSRDVGNSTIYADVRVRHQDSTSSFVYRDYEISLIQLPCCICLMPDKSEPQVGGTAITWTACASYPDQDQLRYKFWVYGGGWNVGRDWDRSNSWTWTPNDPGGYDIKVEVCDVRAMDSNVLVGNATYWEYSISTKNS
ncbi:MAG: hypothetical protein WBE22_10475 [Halobacteriota archaeon]